MERQLLTFLCLHSSSVVAHCCYDRHFFASTSLVLIPCIVHRVLAATTYIFCASAIPALAFGQQLSSETDGKLNVIHVLIATSAAGLIQGSLGGQPLLIIGVAEPIVLVYMYMYKFAKDKEELFPSDGRGDLFLPWAGWVCLWAGLMVVLLAVTNACVYITKFTRYAGEAFGFLIAMLFLQQAIKGTVEEYSKSKIDDPGYSLANGLWSTILAFGLLLTSLLVRTARHWRFLRSPLRSFLADYGVPLLLVIWGAVGYLVRGPPGAPRTESIPNPVDTPNTWDMPNTWTIAGSMSDVPSKYIAAALVPALIIAVLFFFDHNVSSQLAQQPEFNLKKPSAYHWDMLLLGIMCMGLGLLGLPPVNGVIPQSPMHTKALAKISKRKVPGSSSKVKEEAKISSNGSLPNGSTVVHIPSAPLQQQSSQAVDVAHNGAGLNKARESIRDSEIAHLPTMSKTTPPDTAAVPQPPSRSAVDPESLSSLDPSRVAVTEREKTVEDMLYIFTVAEQRWSNLGQGLAVGVLLACTPAIRLLPTAVLWGYFAFMALESLPGSQLWDRTLLLLTDPKRRHLILEHTHAPYLETVRMRMITMFTVLQLVIVGGIYGLTWAGVAGILFPIPIMALVPIRHYVLPRLFPDHVLEELDCSREEAAEPLPHDEAIAEAISYGLDQGSPEIISEMDEREMLDAEMTLRYNRIVHHPTHSELVHRRASIDQETGASSSSHGGMNRGDDRPHDHST